MPDVRCKLCDSDIGYFTDGEKRFGKFYCMNQDCENHGGIPEDTGLSASYYIVEIHNPNHGKPYIAECLDIMEALDMTVHENNIFKAIWRKAAERQGKRKANNSALRDAEKIAFFGNRILELEKLK